jgi:hypothetical protein
MMKIDIEESKKFVELGIIVITDVKSGKKTYMKLGSTDEKGYTELIPLSTEELKKIGIEETQQGETQDREISIEESEEGETETERRFREEKEKANLILKGDPETVNKAKKILEDAMAKQKSEKELTEENEDLREKLDLQAQLAFERKKKELGCTDSQIDSADKLIAWEKGLESKKGAPSGSAGLEGQGYYEQFKGQGEDIAKKKFASHGEMVRFLKDNSEDPNVKHYIDLLWKKAVQAMKSGQKIEYNPQSEAKNESDQPIEIKDWSQLKLGQSEIREMLERANQKARDLIHLQSERRVAQREKQKESEKA